MDTRVESTENTDQGWSGYGWKRRPVIDKGFVTHANIWINFGMI